MPKWLLPESIEDILPAEATRIEYLRRALLDTFRVHGYELVGPPLLEYLESLLTGTGRDLDLSTFKLVDQLTGRMMGLRADITPQVARIDAHLINCEGVTRLCYCGPVLHTLPTGMAETREPLQIGAEIYGHAGLESDLEIQALLLSALAVCGIASPRLDLGHVDIFRAIASRAGIATDLESELFAVLQAKDIPALRELTVSLPAEARDALRQLPALYGGVEVLGMARKVLPDYPEINRALRDLEIMAAAVKTIPVGIDLAELRGYHYYTGVVFSAYCDGLADAVARGGRYDDIGKAFGRARPATGFSMNLRQLARVGRIPEAQGAVRAPAVDDPALREKIAALRASGEIVVQEFPGHKGECGEMGCDRVLAKKDGKWQIERITRNGS